MTPRVGLWYWGRLGAGPPYTESVARSLMAAGCRVSLSLSAQAEGLDRLCNLGIPCQLVSTYTGPVGLAAALPKLPAYRRRLATWLHRHPCDVVIGTMSHIFNPACIDVIHGAGARYLLVLHDAAPHPGEDYTVRTIGLRREISRADGIVCLTEHVRDRLVGESGYRGPTGVVPLGGPDYGDGQPRRHPTGRPFRLLFFGRIMDYKGPERLLPMMDELAQLGHRVELRVVGRGDPALLGPGAADRADCHIDAGYVDDAAIPGILASADAVIMPYREASQSGVVVAAHSAGLPVVATAVGGLVEQIENGVDGLLVAEQSPRALATAVASLVGDRQHYEDLSAGAVRAFHGHSSWQALGRRFVDTLDAVRGAMR